MTSQINELNNFPGLTENQISALQQQYGKNVFHSVSEHRLLRIIWEVVREPMFILLLIACSLYFVLADIAEGVMMAAAMMVVATISVYQEVKSSRALEALKQFTEPKVTVIRDNKEQVISNEELVPGDIMLMEEGRKVPADAVVLQANDLSINESVISGESMPVDKHQMEGHNLLYQGSTVNSGKCIARVSATGDNTVLGKIGKAIAVYNPPKTLLQLQINKFVKRFALFGFIAFCVILVVNYLHYGEFVTSLLFGLTLAMSVVPEEIPVAFSSFMALGAYKMSKFGIISRRPQIIENLGAVTVLCLDKTGTITENKMKLKAIYDYDSNRLINMDDVEKLDDKTILLYATLACESSPFDPMEKAIHEAYHLHADGIALENFKMIFEYPLEGRPPMMTHVYRSGDTTIVASKGGAERILAISNLPDGDKKQIVEYVRNLATKGLRVLGVASARHLHGELPVAQDDFNWQFEGLLALYDPPKKNVSAVLKKIYEAKIGVKLLTGDYPETAMNIARQVGIFNPLNCQTGDAVMNMNDDELRKIVKGTNIFARMFPDAKVRVIKAIQSNSEIVAMSGDGVNDGPALRVADIGIAMGNKGTETAQQAADLILTDDNLEQVITAVAEGRKIFNNLIKAIRYIIAIHVPIILTASLPLILGWRYPNIFTPIHIIFLELIMAPTCSVFFEREPVEANIMHAAPRNRASGLFTFDEFLIGIVQGLIIAAGVLLIYSVFMKTGHSIEETRTMVFTTLIISNIFLTFTSRSFTQTMYYTCRYKNSLAPVVLIISVFFLALLLFIPGVRAIFQLAPVGFTEFWVCFFTAFASVMWFEVYKMDLWKSKLKTHLPL